MKPNLIVENFDLYLKSKNLSFSAVVIGGAALSILGVITRQTQDVDVLDPLYIGEAIHFQTLGRIDLIGTKVLAYCDRGFDLQDCIDLKITKSELSEIIDWVKNYDANPDWPNYVDSQVRILAKKLGYEF
jgi:hypothetical protein